MEPLVSVIMPTYKGARFIERSIKSVLLQTMTNFELIVVDDTSPDNTEQVVREFDDPRIIYIRKPGPYLVAGECARNDGMKVARGRYFCYLDHDDTYKPKFLETMSAYLDAHLDVGLAFCDYVWHRNLSGRKGNEIARRDLSRDFDMALMKRTNLIAVLTVMHRREVVDRVGYFRDKRRRYSHLGASYSATADWDYWFRIAQHFKVKHIPITLGDKIHKSSDHYWDKSFAPYLES